MQEPNNPLSCHIGMHFTRKEGKANICMYCNVEVIKAEHIVIKYPAQPIETPSNSGDNN